MEIAGFNPVRKSDVCPVQFQECGYFQVDNSVQKTQRLFPFLQVKRGNHGVQRTELLPGDRDNLAIQTRGGPEKHEVTGWVLVSTETWQGFHSQDETQPTLKGCASPATLLWDRPPRKCAALFGVNLTKSEDRLNVLEPTNTWELIF